MHFPSVVGEPIALAALNALLMCVSYLMLSYSKDIWNYMFVFIIRTGVLISSLKKKTILGNDNLAEMSRILDETMTEIEEKKKKVDVQVRASLRSPGIDVQQPFQRFEFPTFPRW